jgi:hypothetical protein
MSSRTSELLEVDTLFVGAAHRTPGALAALQRTHEAVSPRGTHRSCATAPSPRRR